MGSDPAVFAVTSEGFFEFQEFILFPSQTIYFHHESYSDF